MTSIYNWLYDYISPIFGYIMLGIYKLVGGFGGYGFALILFTILARCFMIPTSISQQKGMAKQQRLAPKIRRIQEKYAGNQQKIQEETQALYQREGYNPMSAGCLPMLIQMPLIIGLFGVMYNPLRYALGINVDDIKVLSDIFVDFAKSSSNEVIQKLVLDAKGNISTANSRYFPMYVIQYFNDIKGAIVASGKVSSQTIDAISQFVATKKFELFGIQLGARPNVKNFDVYWAIPIFSGVTSLLQSIITQAQQKKANPAMANNPTGGCMMLMMPAMSVWFTFMFPAGIGVYWGVSNIFSIVQSIIMKKVCSPQHEIAKLMVKETVERRSREASLKRVKEYEEKSK
ncbi:MAG: YidC/Oxa1 family membrane protein insertase [Clostridia bacterium]|nr:YidC/Oxa1 family membrane protein insertase [Clostridia bacterium]